MRNKFEDRASKSSKRERSSSISRDQHSIGKKLPERRTKAKAIKSPFAPSK